jgi:hypothetical protein
MIINQVMLFSKLLYDLMMRRPLDQAMHVWSLEIPLVVQNNTAENNGDPLCHSGCPVKANMPLFSLEKTTFEKAT